MFQWGNVRGGNVRIPTTATNSNSNEQLCSSPSERNATREKNTKRNINKQLHNAQISESTDNCQAHGPICQPTSIIGSATKRTRISRQIYKDNKESLNKRLLQELHFVRNILDLSAIMALGNLKANISWHSVITNNYSSHFPGFHGSGPRLLPDEITSCSTAPGYKR